MTFGEWKQDRKVLRYNSDELFYHVISAMTFGIAIGIFIGWWYL